MRRNNAIFGLIIGLFAPAIGVMITYLIWFRAFPLDRFFHDLFTRGETAAKVVSLSVLINVVPFILYTNRKLDLTGRGILIATMLYGVLFMLLKFVW